MTSLRYLILVAIYIIGYYFSKSKDENSNKINILYSQLFVLVFSTFIFFYVIKYLENDKCKENKLPPKYILSQSVFYSIIAVISQYLYQFFLEKNCVDSVTSLVNNIATFTYIPEAFFVAGLVLLINQLSYIIYPKCQ